ncbi:MAG TPA: dTMP kinase [Gemmatimonadales bacterium]|nr:dTMP kinase [Gemmatimonadales bacterium]
MTQGFFLVIEGTEGAGKSTLTAGLVRRLRAEGEDPLAVREPGGTPLAERLRTVLLESDTPMTATTELFLFLAARADLVASVIRPALEQGRTVLADRFQLSTEAYQGGGRGLDRELIGWANRAATGGLQADLTLVLDLPAGQGFDRLRQSGARLDRIEREGPAFHARVADVFRSAAGSGILHLDATLPSEQVLERAWQELEARRSGARPVARD